MIWSIFSLLLISCNTQIFSSEEQNKCMYFQQSEYAKFSDCKFQKPFPINISVTVTILKDINWKGQQSWGYYMSDYTPIKDFCMAGTPFPSQIKKGQTFVLELLCQNLPLYYLQNRYIILIIFWEDLYTHTSEMDYVFVPVPGYTQNMEKKQKKIMAVSLFD